MVSRSDRRPQGDRATREAGPWVELARHPLGPEAGRLWTVLADQVEHPERYLPGLRGAEVLDHDPGLVLRRAVSGAGETWLEWVRTAPREQRLEVRRRGATWAWAEGVREQAGATWLVVEVREARAARTQGGIDARWARALLAATHAALVASRPGAPPAPGGPVPGRP